VNPNNDNNNNNLLQFITSEMQITKTARAKKKNAHKHNTNTIKNNVIIIIIINYFSYVIKSTAPKANYRVSYDDHDNLIQLSTDLRAELDSQWPITIIITIIGRLIILIFIGASVAVI
jgi:hypothetical protein